MPTFIFLHIDQDAYLTFQLSPGLKGWKKCFKMGTHLLVFLNALKRHSYLCTLTLLGQAWPRGRAYCFEWPGRGPWFVAVTNLSIRGVKEIEKNIYLSTIVVVVVVVVYIYLYNYIYKYISTRLIVYITGDYIYREIYSICTDDTVYSMCSTLQTFQLG